MAIDLDEMTLPVYEALKAAGVAVEDAEAWDDQTDAELKLSEAAHVQVGFDRDGAYYVLGVWVDGRTLHSGPMRADVADVVGDAVAWLERGELRGPG